MRSPLLKILLFLGVISFGTYIGHFESAGFLEEISDIDDFSGAECSDDTTFDVLQHSFHLALECVEGGITTHRYAHDVEWRSYVESLSGFAPLPNLPQRAPPSLV